MLLPGVQATLDLHDDTQLWTYWYGTRFEAPTPAVLSRWASQSSCFFDIGANYGFFSFFISVYHPTLQVFSFEPNPAIFARLAQICIENELSSISPQPYGLSDRAGHFEFQPLTENSGHSSFASFDGFAPKTNRSDSPTRFLETKRFDDFVTEAKLTYPSIPSWIAKIDVEGFEPKVLAGMSYSLRCKAFLGLCIETFDENLALTGSNSKEIEKFLARFGYIRTPEHAVIKSSFKSAHYNSFFTLQTSF